MNFPQQLLKRVMETGSNTCLTLRPNLEEIPVFILEKVTQEMGYDLDAIGKILVEYGCLIIGLAADKVPVLNLDLVFFEQYGPYGLIALLEIAQFAKENGMIVFVDGERVGDREQMTAYSNAYMGEFAAFGQKAQLYPCDALTVLPLYGFESLAPVFETMRKEKKGAFLTLGSRVNSSNDLLNQQLKDGSTITELIAHLIASWADEVEEDVNLHSLGVKVPYELSTLVNLRQIMPAQTFWLTLTAEQWENRHIEVLNDETFRNKVLVENTPAAVLLELPPELLNSLNSENRDDFEAKFESLGL